VHKTDLNIIHTLYDVSHSDSDTWSMLPKGAYWYSNVTHCDHWMGLLYWNG